MISICYSVSSSHITSSGLQSTPTVYVIISFYILPSTCHHKKLYVYMYCTERKLHKGVSVLVIAPFPMLGGKEEIMLLKKSLRQEREEGKKTYNPGGQQLEADATVGNFIFTSKIEENLV